MHRADPSTQTRLECCFVELAPRVDLERAGPAVIVDGYAFATRPARTFEALLSARL